MKSYVANGTGSQQTLTDSQDNKIPVYDSVADAESDLANLAENQIIATHDTGSELSAPVDVVQSGNMHAVSSNAVAKSLSYSTTEQATGGKWIDGKPIYRKVFYSATNWGNTDTDLTIGNISFETIVNIRNISKYTSGGYYQNFGESNGTYSMAYVKDNGDVVRQRDGGFLNTYPSSVIIEYTKPNN